MNLKIKDTLAKLLSFVLTSMDVKSGTLASGVTGFANYVKVGRLVTIHGVLTTKATKSAGSLWVSGFPRPLNSYTVGKIESTGVTFSLTDMGELRNVPQVGATSGTRFAFSYISMN